MDESREIVDELIERIRSEGTEVNSRLGRTKEILGTIVEFDPVDLLFDDPIRVVHLESDELLRKLPIARKLLEEFVRTRRAVIPLGSFGEDGETVCLTSVQFLIRDGKLLTFVFARSLDVAGKLHDDAVAVALNAKELADDLDVGLGSIVFLVSSAHVYDGS